MNNNELSGKFEAQRRELESTKQIIYREMMSIITLAETLKSKIFHENQQTQRELQQYCKAMRSHAEFLKGFAG